MESLVTIKALVDKIMELTLPVDRKLAENALRVATIYTYARPISYDSQPSSDL